MEAVSSQEIARETESLCSRGHRMWNKQAPGFRGQARWIRSSLSMLLRGEYIQIWAYPLGLQHICCPGQSSLHHLPITGHLAPHHGQQEISPNGSKAAGVSVLLGTEPGTLVLEEPARDGSKNTRAAALPPTLASLLLLTTPNIKGYGLRVSLGHSPIHQGSSS